ncbi:MAG: hypothetical protein V1776_00575 [Candidatus Diapherotrites archaeon]
MTKPLPRPSRGKKWIFPQRGIRGRGVYHPLFTPPPRSLTYLGIRFESDGSVHVPRYAEREGMPEELVVSRRIKLKNQYAAIRHVSHTRESIQNELRALSNVWRHIGSVHYAIEKVWKNSSPEQQLALLASVQLIAGAMGNQNQLKSFYKKRALLTSSFRGS